MQTKIGTAPKQALLTIGEEMVEVVRDTKESITEFSPLAMHNTIRLFYEFIKRVLDTKGSSPVKHLEDEFDKLDSRISETRESLNITKAQLASTKDSKSKRILQNKLFDSQSELDYLEYVKKRLDEDSRKQKILQFNQEMLFVVYGGERNAVRDIIEMNEKLEALISMFTGKAVSQKKSASGIEVKDNWLSQLHFMFKKAFSGLGRIFSPHPKKTPLAGLPQEGLIHAGGLSGLGNPSAGHGAHGAPVPPEEPKSKPGHHHFEGQKDAVQPGPEEKAAGPAAKKPRAKGRASKAGKSKKIKSAAAAKRAAQKMKGKSGREHPAEGEGEGTGSLSGPGAEAHPEDVSGSRPESGIAGKEKRLDDAEEPDTGGLSIPGLIPGQARPHAASAQAKRKPLLTRLFSKGKQKEADYAAGIAPVVEEDEPDQEEKHFHELEKKKIEQLNELNSELRRLRKKKEDLVKAARAKEELLKKLDSDINRLVGSSVGSIKDIVRKEDIIKDLEINAKSLGKKEKKLKITKSKKAGSLKQKEELIERLSKKLSQAESIDKLKESILNTLSTKEKEMIKELHEKDEMLKEMEAEIEMLKGRTGKLEESITSKQGAIKGLDYKLGVLKDQEKELSEMKRAAEAVPEEKRKVYDQKTMKLISIVAEFASGERNKGFPDSKIKEALIAKNWPMEIIKEGMKRAL